jgi:HSP20 family protein
MSDDFEDWFDSADNFQRKIMKKMFREIEDIEEAIKTGKLEGEWDIKPIEEPGVKGYIAKGRFQYGDKAAQKTFELPQNLQEEAREPLTDVFQDKDNVKLYIELPGVEKKDIQLNVSKDGAEVKTKKFQKEIDLPTVELEFNKAKTSYKNGVLEVTIPKAKKTSGQEQKTAIKVE